MSAWENFLDIYLRGMRDRSIRSRTELAREIQLTDWSTAGNLSNRSSGVQIPRDICTRFGRYLYSTKCSWMVKLHTNSLIPANPFSNISRFFTNLSRRQGNPNAGSAVEINERTDDDYNLY